MSRTPKKRYSNMLSSCRKLRNSIVKAFQSGSDKKVLKHSIQLAERTLSNPATSRQDIANAEYLSMRKIKTIFSAYSSAIPKQSSTGIDSNTNLIRLQTAQINEVSRHDMAYQATKLCRPIRFSNIESLDPETGPRYLLIRFPFFYGRLEKRHSKDSFYANTVFWQGEYHGLTIYACGNMSNLIHGSRVLNSPLWDPSGDESARELFCGEYREEDEFFEVPNNRIDELFENSNSSLHDGTRRRREGQHAGWRDMLLRCDYIKYTDTGNLKIFGSPVWSIRVKSMPYGWYEVENSRTNQLCLAEWNNKWTGSYCLVNMYTSQYYRMSKSAKRLVRFDENAFIDSEDRILSKSTINISHFSESQFPKSEPKRISNLRSCIISANEWRRLTQ